MKFQYLIMLGLALAVRASEEEASQEQTETVEEPVVTEQHTGADFKLLFTKPVGGDRLISGEDAQILVGMVNRAEEDLQLDTLDASFRYAMDFTYVLQNLSAIAYNRKLAPGQEASLFYQFHVSDAFAGRPIGLEVSVVYHDSLGKFYRQAVFNSTLNVEEPEVTFDVETMFLYVMMVAAIVLGVVLLFNCLGGGKKTAAKAARATETGTKGQGVDYEWLPNNVLKAKSSPSPRQRKAKNS